MRPGRQLVSLGLYETCWAFYLGNHQTLFLRTLGMGKHSNITDKLSSYVDLVEVGCNGQTVTQGEGERCSRV